jgi:predicted nucleic acid-binding protein
MVLDTSGLLAFIDTDQHRHEDVKRSLEADPGPFLLSPFVAAEVDYLLLDRVGPAAELLFLSEVARGAYRLEGFGAEDVEQAAQVIGRYRDLRIGLADASLVVLAARAGTNRLLTLDERHFRAVRPLRGRAFTLLPADA